MGVEQRLNASNGKLAVVTGASRGIGRGIALVLAQSGWDIALTYVDDEGAAQELKSLIRSLGRQVLIARADAGSKSDVDAFYQRVADEFGIAAQLLVNNAGVQTWGPLLEVTEADWDRVITTNLKGCFLNTQCFAQRLIPSGKPGAIVNIGSGSNKMPFPNLAAYTASKGGIEMLTKVAAVELGPHGITVNCVAPGAIEIERTRQENPHYGELWGSITPLGRVGNPTDVAHAVLFFASELGRFVTGQTIWVDGGLFSQPRWPYQTAT